MQTSSPFSLRHCDFVARFFYSFPLRFKKRLETHLASATGSVSPQACGSFPPQANFFFFSCVWAGCTCKVFVFVVRYSGEECAWCETLRKKLSHCTRKSLKNHRVWGFCSKDTSLPCGAKDEETYVYWQFITAEAQTVIFEQALAFGIWRNMVEGSSLSWHPMDQEVV